MIKFDHNQDGLIINVTIFGPFILGLNMSHTCNCSHCPENKKRADARPVSFDPTKYPIEDVVVKDVKNGEMFRRFVQPMTIDRHGWTTIERRMDSFDGIRFSSWVPERVKFEIGHHSFEIPVKNKECRVKGFWIPMCSLWMTNVHVRFIGQDQPQTFQCQFINGKFDDFTRNVMADFPFQVDWDMNMTHFTLKTEMGSGRITTKNMAPDPIIEPANFDPTKYPIQEAKDSKDDSQRRIYFNDGDVFRRFAQPLIVDRREWTTLERMGDTFDGIKFTTWVPERVVFQIGTNEAFEIPVENKECRVKGFWIPFVSLHLTGVQIRFIGKDQPNSFWCSFIYGIFNRPSASVMADSSSKINIGWDAESSQFVMKIDGWGSAKISKKVSELQSMD